MKVSPVSRCAPIGWFVEECTISDVIVTSLTSTELGVHPHALIVVESNGLVESVFPQLKQLHCLSVSAAGRSFDIGEIRSPVANSILESFCDALLCELKIQEPPNERLGVYAPSSNSTAELEYRSASVSSQSWLGLDWLSVESTVFAEWQIPLQCSHFVSSSTVRTAFLRYLVERGCHDVSFDCTPNSMSTFSLRVEGKKLVVQLPRLGATHCLVMLRSANSPDETCTLGLLPLVMCSLKKDLSIFVRFSKICVVPQACPSFLRLVGSVSDFAGIQAAQFSDTRSPSEHAEFLRWEVLAWTKTSELDVNFTIKTVTKSVVVVLLSILDENFTVISKQVGIGCFVMCFGRGQLEESCLAVVA